MNIAFDAKRAIQNYTGLGNYSRFVIESMSEFFPDNRFFLFAPKKRDNHRLDTIRSRSNISFVFPSGAGKYIPSLWRVLGSPAEIKRNRIDVFHGLSNELPFCTDKAKTVVTIHDLIFLRYPEFYKPVDRWIYTQKFRWACRNADMVVAVSECTKRDIISFFGISEEKIQVVYQSCHPQFSQPATDEKRREIVEKYKLPRRYILYVGSIEARKNLLLAVRALQHLPDDIHLVALGRPTNYQRMVEDYAALKGLSRRLHIFNGTPFADFPAFYQTAQAFVYPSFFEGFGIPIIEALNSGTPVVAATGSCLEEAGGGGSVYVDPNNELALADALKTIITNPKLAENMSIEGKKYVQRFEAKPIAERLNEIYQKI